MKIYTIGDLHLSMAVDKPMDIFGTKWANHQEKLTEYWEKTVKEEDLVVIPGDISWGMTPEEAIPDLIYIEELPGKKILLKGNHEYWWGTMNKLKELKATNHLDSVEFLHNSYIYIEEKDLCICGTRGWKCPEGWDGASFSAQDEKIYNREIQRLELSLKAGKEKSDNIVCFMHFPPFNNKGESSGFTILMEKYGVKHCYYGHLHGPSLKDAINGKISEDTMTEYHLVSGDYLGFNPVLVQL